MNEVTKKKKKRRRRKAFIKKLRKMCCIPTEVDSSEDVDDNEEEQANKSERTDDNDSSATTQDIPDNPNNGVQTTAHPSETPTVASSEAPTSELCSETPAAELSSEASVALLRAEARVAVVSTGEQVKEQDRGTIRSCESCGQSGNTSGSSSIVSSVSSSRLGPETAPSKSLKTITAVTSLEEPRKAVNSELEIQILRETLSESQLKNKKAVKAPWWPALSCVKASFHQGSALHFKSCWAGSQCTTMSLTAVVMSAIKPVHQWSKIDLNSILYTGDRNHGYLLASLQRDPQELKSSGDKQRIGLFELKGSVPMKVKGDYHMMDLCPDSQSSGVVFTGPDGEKIHNEFGTPLLKDALARAMESPTATGAVFTVGDFSTGLMKDPTGGYRLWDSHSRGSAGFYRENGSAVLLFFKSLEDVQTHLELQLEMRGSRYETYDVVGFHVELGERAVGKLDRKRQKEEEKVLKRLIKQQKKGNVNTEASEHSPRTTPELLQSDVGPPENIHMLEKSLGKL